MHIDDVFALDYASDLYLLFVVGRFIGLFIS